MRKLKKSALPGMLFGLLALPVAATMLLSLNLDQLTRLSEKIFRGTVASVDRKNGYEIVTFDVSEVFKGDVGASITFKQISSRPQKKAVGKNKIVHAGPFQDVPSFKEKEEVVVFLSAPGDTGLTTAVGFGQGTFRVSKDLFGNSRLVNDYKNMGLFNGMEASSGMKALGLSDARLHDLQTSPRDLYLDQMRIMLKDLNK